MASMRQLKRRLQRWHRYGDKTWRRVSGPDGSAVGGHVPLGHWRAWAAATNLRNERRRLSR